MSAKARHHLGPFGHLIFQGAGEVGEDAAHGGGELLGAFYASYVSGGGVVADEVGGIDLLRDIQVAPLVVQLLYLPAGQGLVLFSGRARSPFSSPSPVVA